MNQGYGWASEIQMKFIFDRLFEAEMGHGFPAHRRDVQKQFREMHLVLSEATHKSFPDIVKCADPEFVKTCMGNEVFYGLIANAAGEYPAAKMMLDIARS